MFRDLYKQNIKTKEVLQEERRNKLLVEQKRRRLLLQDLQRNVDFSCNQHKESSHKQRAAYSKSSNVRVFKDSYGIDYSLQFSEWLRERPSELCDWVLVPCPKGQRCLLIATDGRTDMYSKAGRRRMTFHTLLPGDSGVGGGKMITVLDCVYAPGNDTFYVLDALIYGNQELVHCEAQFRFFWLRSKFKECEQLDNRSRCNEKPLKLIERYDFEEIGQVSEVLQRYPLWPDNEPQLDGWLFYHKEASYTYGTTPLVGWLFPFMVSDVLGIRVSEGYERPENYTEPLAYMNAFDADQKQRRWRHHAGLTEMDTSATLCDEEEDKNRTLSEDTKQGTLIESERKLELDEEDDRFMPCDAELSI